MRDELETSAPDEPFVLRAIAILRRRAMLAFALFALALVAGVAIAVTLPDLFRASAVVLVERQLPESVVRPAVIGELESRLHVIRQEILSRARLTDLEERWAPHGFVRVHRGFVVNLRRAVEVRPRLNGTAVLVMADGTEVPIARRQVGELRRRLAV